MEKAHLKWLGGMDFCNKKLQVIHYESLPVSSDAEQKYSRCRKLRQTKQEADHDSINNPEGNSLKLIIWYKQPFSVYPKTEKETVFLSPRLSTILQRLWFSHGMVFFSFIHLIIFQCLKKKSLRIAIPCCNFLTGIFYLPQFRMFTGE